MTKRAPRDESRTCLTCSANIGGLRPHAMFCNSKCRSRFHNWEMRGITISAESFSYLSDTVFACQACGYVPEETDRSLALDHNHETGMMRGMLCSDCNLALGLLNDDPERVLSLLKYIEERKDV